MRQTNRLENVVERMCGGNPRWVPKGETCQYLMQYKTIDCEVLVNGHCYNNNVCYKIKLYDKK